MHTKYFTDCDLAERFSKLVGLKIRLVKLKRGELSHEFQAAHVGVEVCNAILQTEREIKALKEAINA